MDDKTQQLIEKLAENLGTTAEHLWEVLIRQAPITATTELVMDATLLAGTVWLWRFIWKHDWKVTEYSMVKEAVYTVVAIFTGILVLGIAFNIPLIFAGFFNPEYWALQQIIH